MILIIKYFPRDIVTWSGTMILFGFWVSSVFLEWKHAPNEDSKRSLSLQLLNTFHQTFKLKKISSSKVSYWLHIQMLTLNNVHYSQMCNVRFPTPVLPWQTITTIASYINAGYLIIMISEYNSRFPTRHTNYHTTYNQVKDLFAVGGESRFNSWKIERIFCCCIVHLIYVPNVHFPTPLFPWRTTTKVLSIVCKTE